MAEVVQRLVIQPWIRLRPSSKDRVLTRWMRGLARMALWILRRIGGAKLEVRPTVPAGPGVLVVMNHQSLLDIPMATASVEGGYPRFVTRKRYEKGIPLISHLLKILDCPLVDPGSGDLEQIRRLQVVGRTTTQPLVIFPEGTRSRTGDLRPFKTGGLRAILTGRAWNVYLVVVDGFWQCGKIHEFARHIGGVRGVVRTLGPYPFPGEEADPDRFIDSLREVMLNEIKEIRGSEEVPAS